MQPLLKELMGVSDFIAGTKNSPAGKE